MHANQRSIRACFCGISPSVQRNTPMPAAPTVAELLDVDREYRDKAARQVLPTIAPRRFNPGKEPRLPRVCAGIATG